jgi:gamma-glutamylputrescine oxidase
VSTTRDNLLFTNDAPGIYPQSWYASSVDFPEAAPPLRGSHRYDVAVIGAGFTGLSAALKLQQLGYRVALIDAHRIGWGASGRNGGQLGSGQRVDQESLQLAYGIEHAHRLWELAEEAKSLVKALISDHQICCDYCPGIIHADHRKRFSADTRAYVDMLRTQYQYPDIRYVAGEELHELTGTRQYDSAALDTGAGHLHPLKFALGLASAFRAAGGDIYERSVVEQVQYQNRVIVQAADGLIEADSLIFACNGYLGNLQSSVAERVMPINNFIIATAPLDSKLNDSILRENMAVADSRFVVNYFRKSIDGRLLFGGRESYGYRFPPDIKTYVRGAMIKIYPQLQSTAIEFGWGGTLAITMNRLPHIRRLRANVYSASGYSGHGVGMATLSGHLVAQAIDGTVGKYDLLAGIPHRKFPGGVALRSPLLKLAMFYYSLRDKL